MNREFCRSYPLWILCLLLGATTSVFAQGAGLSDFEQAIVDETNAARTDPSAYAQHLVKRRSWYDGRLRRTPGQTPIRTQEGVSALNEAIRYLRNADALPPLRVSVGMSQAAQDHVDDMAATGRTGHQGSNGSRAWDRMERYGSWSGYAGENIAYSGGSPRDIVIQLIVDDGVPSRGHRENIFKPIFRHIGVACGPHPRYPRACVTTFAGGFTEDQAASSRATSAESSDADSGSATTERTSPESSDASPSTSDTAPQTEPSETEPSETESWPGPLHLRSSTKGRVVGGYRIGLNTKYDLLYFRDPENARRNHATYDFERGCWRWKPPRFRADAVHLPDLFRESFAADRLDRMCPGGER